MTRLAILACILSVGPLFGCRTLSAAATDKPTQPAWLIGTWRAVSAVEILDDGTVRSPPYGSEPTGYIMYDATGHMAVQLFNPEMPRVALEQASAEELRTIATSSVVYSGRYEVDETKGVVKHYVELGLDPKFLGRVLTREYRLDGSRLTLRVPPFQEAGITRRRTLVWERVR